MKLFSTFVLSFLSGSGLYAMRATAPSTSLPPPPCNGLVLNNEGHWTLPGLQSYKCSVIAFKPPIQGLARSIYTNTSDAPLKVVCLNLYGATASNNYRDESDTDIAIICNSLARWPNIVSLEFGTLQYGYAIGTAEFSSLIMKDNLRELILPKWEISRNNLHMTGTLKSALSRNKSIEYLTVRKPTLAILESLTNREATFKKLSLLDLDYLVCGSEERLFNYIKTILLKNQTSLQILEITNSNNSIDVTELYDIISKMEKLVKLSVPIDSNMALHKFSNCKFSSLESLTIEFKSTVTETRVFAKFLISHLTITELSVGKMGAWGWIYERDLLHTKLNLTSLLNVNYNMWPHLQKFFFVAPKISSFRFGNDHRHEEPTDALAQFLTNNKTIEHLIWDGPVNDKFVTAMVANTSCKTLQLTCAPMHVSQSEITTLKRRFPDLIHPTTPTKESSLDESWQAYLHSRQEPPGRPSERNSVTQNPSSVENQGRRRDVTF